MDCKKCSGLMSYEGFYGSESDAVWYYPGWRCIHCGDIVDSVIALNRSLNCASHKTYNGHENGNRLTNGHARRNGNGYGKKNGKTNGFILKKTAVSHDYRHDDHAEDEDYAGLLQGSHNSLSSY